MCDDDSVYFIQHFCAYAKKRTGVKTLTEEMEKPNFMVGDVEFEKNLIYFKFYNENIFIQFKKANNTYKIIGFNGVESRHLSPVGIKEDYTDYLRALKLIRSEQYRNKEIN